MPAALAALAFLATLVLHAPAPLLYHWATAGKPLALDLQGIEGTLMHGKVRAIGINHRPLISDLGWTLHPAWLGLLRLTADLEAGGDNVIRVRVSRAPFGRLRLSDLNAAASVRSLLAASGQPALPVEGQIKLDFSSLQLDKGAPVRAQGTAELSGLAWTLAREPLVLGDFSANVETEADGIVARLVSGTGPLELSGEARLSEDRKYDVHLQMRPRANASAQLQTLVKSIGNPDLQGFYHLRRNGTLGQ
jgi:general secretion pathway protein N